MIDFALEGNLTKELLHQDAGIVAGFVLSHPEVFENSSWRKLMPFKDKSRYQSEEWKEYQRNYQRSWHQRHKEKRLAKSYKRRAAIYEYVQEIKSQLCCADCGERHPATLQFHHLNSEDKMFNIGNAISDGISLNRIQKEIEKCIVLCANCHAIRHYNMRNKKRTSPGIAGELEELDTLLAIRPGEEDAYNMQFEEKLQKSFDE